MSTERWSAESSPADFPFRVADLSFSFEGPVSISEAGARRFFRVDPAENAQPRPGSPENERREIQDVGFFEEEVASTVDRIVKSAFGPEFGAIRVVVSSGSVELLLVLGATATGLVNVRQIVETLQWLAGLIGQTVELMMLRRGLPIEARTYSVTLDTAMLSPLASPSLQTPPTPAAPQAVNPPVSHTLRGFLQNPGGIPFALLAGVIVVLVAALVAVVFFVVA